MRALITAICVLSIFAHYSEEESITLPIRFAEDAEEDNFGQAFFQSFSAIFVSEIGDRTFFVAAVMAMRYNKYAVFVGSAGALVLMTSISCIFGYIVPQLIPKIYTQVIAMILFFFFGLKLLYEWRYGKEHSDEKQEVENDMTNLHEKFVLSTKENVINDDLANEQIEDLPDTKVPITKQKQRIPLKHVIWQAFILTFLGEWGDRSQFATIGLAAVHPAWIVFIGGSIGHILCTIIAILAGDYVSEKITEKTVNLVGGIVFTIFGIIQAVQILV